MRYGIHLPQFGDALSAGAVERAAAAAEELGFDDVWVSDHLVTAEGQTHPSPSLYDPLVALAFAAAATERVGIGTSVLVAPQYPSPLAVANALATLDFMSGGRLTVGAGIGWSRAEYDALHAPFDNRAERLDEIIALWRTAWSDDPATHEGRFYPFERIHVLPKPAHDVPIWRGGHTDAAIERATRVADGFHAIGIPPADAPALVDKVRARRPEPSYTVSIRLVLDVPAAASGLAAAGDEYAAAGVQHLLYDPHGPNLSGLPGGGGIDEWLDAARRLADEVGLG